MRDELAIRVLIVDDERLARARLRGLLSDIGARVEIAEAANALEALDALGSFCPQVVFLDVEMPSLSGFDLLAHVPEASRTFVLIFCTAYSEYALRAFEEAACDYLLKPVRRERLLTSWGRVRQQLEQGGIDAAAHDAVENSLAQHQQWLRRLIIRLGRKTEVLAVESVEYFACAEEVVSAHVYQRELPVEMSMAKLEARLPPDLFIRTHRNFIVNTQAVVQVFHGDECKLRLKGGALIPVSRRNKKLIKQKLRGAS